MLKNEGAGERAIRVLAGFGMVGAGYLWNGLGDIAAVVAMVIGGVLILTGIVGYCPIWHTFGVSTTGDRQGLAQK